MCCVCVVYVNIVTFKLLKLNGFKWIWLTNANIYKIIRGVNTLRVYVYFYTYLPIYLPMYLSCYSHYF